MFPLCAFLAVVVFEPGEKNAPAEAVSKVKPAVISIQAAKERVLGVLVDPRGVVVAPLDRLFGFSKVEVKLADGRKFVAKVLAADAKNGAAVLLIETDKPLPHAKLADSAKVNVGDWIVGVSGDSALTVCVEIISATNRAAGIHKGLLQSDSSLGPGSRNDILINREGEIVGIGFRPTAGIRSIGLAVPSNRIKELIRQFAPKRSHP